MGRPYGMLREDKWPDPAKNAGQAGQAAGFAPLNQLFALIGALRFLTGVYIEIRSTILSKHKLGCHAR